VFLLGKDRTDAQKTKCGNGGLVPGGNKIMLILESEVLIADLGPAQKIQKIIFNQ
jgi:hypothetical protein